MVDGLFILQQPNRAGISISKEQKKGVGGFPVLPSTLDFVEFVELKNFLSRIFAKIVFHP